MTKKDNCGDKDCGHVRDSHHKEYVSTGDVTKVAPREPQFFNCLAAFCSCEKYVPPKD